MLGFTKRHGTVDIERQRSNALAPSWSARRRVFELMTNGTLDQSHGSVAAARGQTRIPVEDFKALPFIDKENDDRASLEAWIYIILE